MTNTSTTPASTKTAPALYCGTYAKYNIGGSIVGQWMKLNDYADEEEFLTACRELHNNEADPELMFQDFEGFPKELYSESMGAEDIGKIYDFITLDEDDQKMIAAYAEATGNRLGDINYTEDAQEAFAGQWDSDEDFAQNMAEDIGAIDPKASWPNTCIDWEMAARELMYDYCEHNGYYFRNC